MTNKYSKKPVLATIIQNGFKRAVRLDKRLGQTIRALVEKGSRGVTALEMSSWALRLGAYIFTLRHEYRLEILTLREPHEGGSHARYVLITPVTLTELQDV